MRKASCKSGHLLPFRRHLAVMLFPVFAGLFGLGACTGFSKEGAANEQGSFFDLEKLVNEQITYLEATRPETEKVLALNEKNEQLVTQDINWADELSLFRQADINKSSFSDSYEVDRSDPMIEIYRLKPGHVLPVQSLRVHYTNGTVTEVNAEMKVENKLFDSFKEMTLHLNGNPENNHLVSYHMKGFQQWLLGDKTSFEVKGKVK